MGRRRVLAAASWAAAVVTSTGVGVIAAGIAGAGLTPTQLPEQGPFVQVGSAARATASETQAPQTAGRSGPAPTSGRVHAPTAAASSSPEPTASARPTPARADASPSPGRAGWWQHRGHGRAVGTGSPAPYGAPGSYGSDPASGSTGTQTTEAGKVMAGCGDGWMRLAWSPNPGWRADQSQPGGSGYPTARVDFTRDHKTVRVTVGCPHPDRSPEFAVSRFRSAPGRGDSTQNR